MRAKKKKSGSNSSIAVFQIFNCGVHGAKVSDADLCDLLAIPKRKENHWLLDKRESRSQSIVFEDSEKLDTSNSANEDSLPSDEEASSARISFPLLHNAPEGARVLAVLAASRRREMQVQIPLPSNVAGLEGPDDDELICFCLDHGLAKMTQRWTRLNTDRTVFVYENSVPASVIPVDLPSGKTLYSCCANTLELRGGGLRAEGLTLLPPGSVFLLLSLLVFGLSPDGLGSVPDDDDDERLHVFIEDCLNWINEKDSTNKEDEHKRKGSIDWPSRIRMALDLARSCVNLGERLICYPDKVKMLCGIFDGVDGYSTEVWERFESNPFIPRPENEQKFIASLLAEMRNPGSFYEEPLVSNNATEFLLNGASMPRNPRAECAQLQETMEQINLDESRADNNHQAESAQLQETMEQTNLDQSTRADPVQEEEKKSREADKILRGTEVLQFSDSLVSKSRSMFAAEIPTEESSLADLPTTNILSLCIKNFYAELAYDAFMQPNQREDLLAAAERFGNLRLTRDHWIVHRFVTHDGKEWYRALFVESTFPLKSPGTKGMPKWYRHLRPWTMDGAMGCAPVSYRTFNAIQAVVYEEGDLKRRAILFESIEVALRMEACFFLERHFFCRNKHWYEQPFHELMQQLLKRIPSSSQILLNVNSSILNED